MNTLAFTWKGQGQGKYRLAAWGNVSIPWIVSEVGPEPVQTPFPAIVTPLVRSVPGLCAAAGLPTAAGVGRLGAEEVGR